MALLGKIRSKGVLLIVIIGLALLLFIVNDALTQGSSFFNKSRETVAEILGDAVNIRDYSESIEQMNEVYKIETGQNELNEEIQSQLRGSVWESLVNEKLLFAEAKKIGLTVSTEELKDNLLGDRIHPMISQRRMFANESGQFDKVQLQRFYDNIHMNPENEEMRQQIEKIKNYWLFWEHNVKISLLQDKYNQLLAKAITANSLDAKMNFEASSKIYDIDYIVQSYFTVPDSTIKVTDSEIKALYNKRKEQFKQEASRSINYITFTVKPSQDDYSEAEKWINQLADEFKTTDDVAGLVNSNSDVMYDGRNYSENSIPLSIKDFAFGNAAGAVMGPVFANDTYTMARIMEAGILMPDSVKLRHIYLTPDKESKTDSIVSALKSGADFATLARKYSAVQQTAAAGGEIGWIQEGVGFDKEITGAAFSKAVNEIFTLKNAQGTQIMQVTEKTSPRRKVKVAILERKVVPTSRTVSQYFNDAKQFIADVPNQEKFDKKAQEKGLPVRQANELLKESQKVSDIPQSRQIVRWAFEKDKGAVSEVFDCENTFIVATITDVSEKGYSPLQKVSTQLRSELIRDKKAEQIISNLNAQLAKTSVLGEIAQTIGTDVKEALGVTFSAYQFGTAGFEPAVIGKITKLGLNKISSPIKGNAGVYVVMPKNIQSSDNQFDVKAQISQLNSRTSYTVPYSIIQQLREKANIKDNRLNFY